MKPTVLVVEDDAPSARLIELILASRGYQVTIAPDGPVGLELARSDRPDLILLDLMLPVMNGLEIISQLRTDSRTAHIPIIVVSAKARAIDIHKATEIGAAGYVSKPYRKQELLNAIEAALDGTA